MTSKASRRLHYLRLLTKQGTSVTDLVQIYLALGAARSKKCIISLGGRRSVPDLPTQLKTRREEAAVHLFERMLRDDHPLNDLVPPTRSAATGLSLRNAERIILPPARWGKVAVNHVTHPRLWSEEGALSYLADKPRMSHVVYRDISPPFAQRILGMCNS
ncbi:hypothetical protein Bbelb_388130 [Branchiostoma belcheri]|nr:hypothetical protein Bbelb_388130 [Branchiostoma belcheri]